MNKNIIDLKKQIERNIEHHIHEIIGLDEESYRTSLLSLIDTCDLELGTSYVLIENRISLNQLLERSSVENYLAGEEIRFEKVQKNEPYLIEVIDPRRYLGLSPEQAETAFATGESGCTIFEVVSIYFHLKEQFNERAVDSLLSWFRVDYHPTLVSVGGYVGIGAHWHKDTTGNMGVVSKRTKIISL